MGRKRHIVTDTLGLLIGLVIHAADIQDRDGAPAVLKSILKRWPWLRHVFADGGYAGPKLRKALQKVGSFTLEIIKRSDSVKGFGLVIGQLLSVSKEKLLAGDILTELSYGEDDGEAEDDVVEDQLS